MQVVIELWACMHSCKKEVYRKTVDQSLLVFKRQEKEENPSKERKITEDEESQDRRIS